MNVEPLDERFTLLEELFEETVEVADQMDVIQFEALFCSIVQLRGFQNLYIAFFAICVVYIQLFYLPELAAEFVMVVVNAAANLFQCADIFPKKLDTLRNHVDIEFAYKGMYRLIVCPECNTLYKPETAQYAPICTSKKFGVICGAVLIQNLVPGARKMYGNLVAPFNSIQHALTLMFARDGFESLIEVWRDRTRHQDTMYDIYDGQLWSEFEDKNGQVFTTQSRSLMFTLNVDWFQPSKGVTYSVGAFYLTINNLPRHLRYKRENVILVCLTPGPKEPSTIQLNNYLQVMVDQLNSLYYNDFQICTAQSPNRPVTIRAALILIACDIPASRKVGGFTSFNATVPCNKCQTQFPHRGSTVLQRNFAYGLENYESWVLRTNDLNRQHALEWKEV